MRVWRIEHDCNIHHGPVMTYMGDENSMCQNIDYRNRPKYGTRGSTPHHDGLDTIYDNEVCGTLDHQFAWWWDHEWDWETEKSHQVEPYLPPGWYVTLFEVPDKWVRVGGTQVTFTRSKAVEVLRTRTEFPKETTL